MTTTPLVTIGGTVGKPLLHLAPANGFVLETYLPILRPFFAEFHCVAVPPRALWQERPPSIDPDTNWHGDAALLREGIKQHDLPPMIGIGHSFGAILTILSSDLFQGMILLDPTILIRPAVDYMGTMQREGKALDNPLAQGALRRRRIFASVEEAFTNFRSKSVFAQWPDEVVRLYAEHGTRPTDTGERTLTWSPEWEAYYFSTVPSDIWTMLVPQLHEIKSPTLILRGGTSETYTAESAHEVAEAWPQAAHQEVEGHGHLFPQSAPEETARLIRAWMTQHALIQGRG
jgi:pimeloyl-ACP methyl ester carboxylesterase